MKKIVISINTSWNIYNFRVGLVKALIDQGFEVIAVAPRDEYSSKLEELGCRFIPLVMDKNGTSLVKDMVLLYEYFRILRAERPHAFLGYTIKPNIYGSLAAHVLGIPVLNNIAGLGATFIRDNFLTKVVRTLYKCALKRSHRVFFQNADDRALFVESGLVQPAAVGLVPGSGLNLAHYVPRSPASLAGRRFRFLLVARMLKDKGIEEFAAAARLLREQQLPIDFQLLGPLDSENPNSVPADRICAWEKEGLVSFLGKTDDVRRYLVDADCVVLPSYREGVPRSLLEAAAMALPIVTTDVVGCRDAIDDGVTGLLCQVKDPVSLSEKMRDIFLMTTAERSKMGAAGRQKIESEFDERIVIQKYLQALESLVTPSRVPAEVPEFRSDAVNS
jgi:glycosyltransferase involved in cell wall biosynthesis